jgi:hypothetical protein
VRENWDWVFFWFWGAVGWTPYLNRTTAKAIKTNTLEIFNPKQNELHHNIFFLGAIPPLTLVFITSEEL